MDVIERIKKLKNERGWSENYLAMEAGITQSTLNSLLNRKSMPQFDTLQSLCNAFGITLAQFFMDDEQVELLTEKEKRLLTAYRGLSAYKQQALIALIENS